MIQSMTGFGASRLESRLGVVAVEVKTVNHKYLDPHIRLPVEFQAVEPAVRKKISALLRRGRVDMFVSIDRGHRRVRLDADPDLIAAYVDLVRGLQRQFPISGELTVESISKLPGAISISSEEATAEEEQELVRQVEAAVDAAMDQLLDMRVIEGKALQKDLQSRIDSIRGHLHGIRAGTDVLVDHYRERLRTRLADLAPSVELDSGRLEVEALILADKSDIAEEITRLGSHLEQFEAAMNRGEEAGKRLDFLLQEMNRETTTILSKTSGLNQVGATIGSAAVEIKVEIDKLREQVQNVE